MSGKSGTKSQERLITSHSVTQNPLETD